MSSPHPDRPISPRRARTRERVVAAAREVIGEKGFQRATLDEIAARAGLTKGAVYSSFDGKAELFLAAVSSMGLRMQVDWPPARSVRAQLRALGEACWKLLPAAQRQGAFIADFYLYALSEPSVRQILEERYAKGFAAAADEMARRLPPGELRMPPESLAIAVQALSLGFVFQSLVSPTAITREIVVAAFEGLA